MRGLRCTMSAVAATIVLLSSPQPCQAWSPSDVMLAFGSTYLSPSGVSTVHHGVDIRLAAGADVIAPCSGEVVFVGAVPSAGGGTVMAASIATPQGRVTLLPLEGARVEEGQQVAEGDYIAALAVGGDVSSPESHLHLGLRQGNLYKDPSVLLVDVVQSRPTNPAPDVVVQPTASSAPSPAPSASTAAPVIVGAPVATPAQAQLPEISVSVPEPVADSAPADGRLQVADGVSVAAPQAVQQGLSQAPGTVSVGERLLDTARGAVHEPLGLAAVLTVLLVCGALLSRRLIVRRLLDRELVSSRLGTVLQHMRAGDTLRGLNSCPGHDAFTVPGPPAQGR